MRAKDRSRSLEFWERLINIFEQEQEETTKKKLAMKN